MVFEGKSLVNFLDLSVSGIFINSEYFVVVLLPGFLFLFLGYLYLVLHVAAGVDFLDLAVVHDGSSVLSPLHVDLSPPDEGLGVFRIQFQGFIEIVESLEGFLPFYEGQGSIRENYCVQLLVRRVQVDRISVFLLSLLVLLVFDELVALLLELLAFFCSHESLFALLVVRVQPHAFGKVLFGPARVTPIEFDDPFEVPEVGALLIDSNPDGFAESESLGGVSGFGQALDFELLEFLAIGDLVADVVDAGEGLLEVPCLDCVQVLFEVGVVVLGLLEFIFDFLALVVLEGYFEGGDGLGEAEDLVAGESLPAQGFGEVGFEVVAGVAVGDALQVLVEVVEGGGPVGEEAVVVGVEFDGFGVALDCLFEPLGAEGLVAVLLPVLC